MESFYWYDYETSGTDPARDRPMQFAGLRTDMALNEIGEPDMFRTALAEDVLPHPRAVLVTGVLPDQAEREGEPEAVFASRIAGCLSRPGSCAVGYNSMRFDAEVSRYLFWRNLIDPYAHEWRDGNSRWDLLDVMRCARLLRPAGLQWPEREDGTPDFRLEALTAANGIAHGEAHDALADVRATLALARLVRDAQPRLFDYLLSLRFKQAVRARLKLGSHEPVLHVSGRFAADRGAASVILPLLADPLVSNRVVCWDLHVDPAPFLDLPEDSLRERLYSRREDLPEDGYRPGIKHVHINRAPVVVAASAALEPGVAERMRLEPAEVAARRDWILRHREVFVARLGRLLSEPSGLVASEPEAALYDGFVGDADRRRLDALRRAVLDALQEKPFAADISLTEFEDARLPTLVVHFLARNLPSALDDKARADWRAHCRRRLGLDSAEPLEKVLGFGQFDAALDEARASASPAERDMLNALGDWAANRKEALMR